MFIWLLIRGVICQCYQAVYPNAYSGRPSEASGLLLRQLASQLVGTPSMGGRRIYPIQLLLHSGPAVLGPGSQVLVRGPPGDSPQPLLWDCAPVVLSLPYPRHYPLVILSIYSLPTPEPKDVPLDVGETQWLLLAQDREEWNCYKDEYASNLHRR